MKLRFCRLRISEIVVCVLLLVFVDLPTHLVDARRQIFLPRGMLGRVDCPVDANPPVTLTVWTKDERVIDRLFQGQKCHQSVTSTLWTRNKRMTDITRTRKLTRSKNVTIERIKVQES